MTLPIHAVLPALLGHLNAAWSSLGATVGDFLDKPVADGGLALSRPIASAVIAFCIVVCLLILPQRAGRHPGQSRGMA